ncbi:MAG: hypothetical protein R2941_14345 [Desulfobacterales bacterium]
MMLTGPDLNPLAQNRTDFTSDVTACLVRVPHRQLAGKDFKINAVSIRASVVRNCLSHQKQSVKWSPVPFTLMEVDWGWDFSLLIYVTSIKAGDSGFEYPTYAGQNRINSPHPVPVIVAVPPFVSAVNTVVVTPETVVFSAGETHQASHHLRKIHCAAVNQSAIFILYHCPDF